MNILIFAIVKIIDLYLLNLAIYAITDLLIAFRLFKLDNKIFTNFYHFIKEANDPIFNIIKKFIPQGFYIDLSFLVAYLIATVLRSMFVSFL